MGNDNEFQPVNVIVCHFCKAQNLSWCMGCWQCGEALFDEEEDVAERHKQENAA